MPDDEKEELTPEELADKEARYKKVGKKIDAFMADIGEDLYDEEIIEKTRDHTLKTLQRNGIPFSKSTLKALIEGESMAIAADKATMMQIIMIQRLILKRMELEMELKVDESLKDKKIN